MSNFTNSNDTAAQAPIMIVKSLDAKTGIVQIFDPVMTMHLTRIPLAFVDSSSIYQFVSSNPAVYILLGPSDDNAHECKAYVGETGSGTYRLDQHFKLKGREWDIAYVISSDNLAFNKAHARSFEHSLFPIISRHPKVLVTNLEVPTRFALAAYDRSLVERALPVIIQLRIASGFPLANVPLFQTGTNHEGVDQAPLANGIGDSVYYRFKPGVKSRFPGLYGEARREGQTYILQPGCEVRMTPNPSYYNEGVERQRLLKEGGPQPHPKYSDRKLTTEPVRFSSWQTAASAMAGANVTNPNYWVPFSNLNVQGLAAEMEVAS